MTKKTKKPARERAPNDYLSLSRSEPGRLAGSSGKLKMCLSHIGLLAEKGRAGGRARLPARPVAVSRSRVCETAVALGVDSCEVSRDFWAWLQYFVGDPAFVGFVSDASCKKQTRCQNSAGAPKDQPSRRRVSHDRSPQVSKEFRSYAPFADDESS